jgi:hypothetical protein
VPDDALPTYLWGDTIKLRMEIEHEANMTDVWAIFRKEGDTPEFRLTLPDSYALHLVEWHGVKRISQVTLESKVDRADHLPGDYVLVAVRGTPRFPVGASRVQAGDYLEFDVPEGVRLQIAEPPPASKPRVAFYKFEAPS